MAKMNEYGNGERINFTMVDNENLIAPIAEFQHNWFACMTKANGEILSFVDRRMKRDMEAAAELTKCKNPVDFLQAQMQFVQKLTADYTEEAQKITKIMSELATNGTANSIDGSAKS